MKISPLQLVHLAFRRVHVAVDVDHMEAAQQDGADAHSMLEGALIKTEVGVTLLEEEDPRGVPYLVTLRVWIDKDIRPDVPFFVFTDALAILDSVTVYHRMEKTSRAWVQKNGGGIFEFHSYALPDDFPDNGHGFVAAPAAADGDKVSRFDELSNIGQRSHF